MAEPAEEPEQPAELLASVEQPDLEGGRTPRSPLRRGKQPREPTAARGVQAPPTGKGVYHPRPLARRSEEPAEEPEPAEDLLVSAEQPADVEISYALPQRRCETRCRHNT